VDSPQVIVVDAPPELTPRELLIKKLQERGLSERNIQHRALMAELDELGAPRVIQEGPKENRAALRLQLAELNVGLRKQRRQIRRWREYFRLIATAELTDEMEKNWRCLRHDARWLAERDPEARRRGDKMLKEFLGG
jgi:hypothetical protein